MKGALRVVAAIHREGRKENKRKNSDASRPPFTIDEISAIVSAVVLDLPQ